MNNIILRQKTKTCNIEGWVNKTEQRPDGLWVCIVNELDNKEYWQLSQYCDIITPEISKIKTYS